MAGRKDASRRRAGARAASNDGARAEVLASLGLPSDATVEEIREARERLDALLQQAETPVAEKPTPKVSRPDDDGTYADVEALDEDPGPETAEAAAQEPAPEPERPATSTRPARGRRSARESIAARTDAGRRPSRPLVATVLLVLVVGLIWGVYAAGSPKQATADQSNPHAMGMPTAAPTSLDPAQVQQLEQKVAAQPNDVEALRSLATLHFRAEKFPEAAQWLDRLLKVRPEDNDARLVRGVALFNSGDLAGAESEWQEVARRDPKSPDPHYNLGFLYMSQTPPAMDRCEAEWRRVVELAPDSDLAKNVTAHLGRVAGAPTSPRPGAGPSMN